MRNTLSYVIAVTSLGFAMVQLDVTIVNVALAQIGVELNTPMSGLQWLVDAYTISIASIMMTSGAIGDRFGLHKTFLLGMTIFTLASLACGLAKTLDMLIVFRVAQGIGAAMIVPCSLSLLNFACADDGKVRSKAIGLWNAAGGLAIIAGPVLGGLLIELIGWRSIFIINIPIGAIGFFMAKKYIQEPKFFQNKHFDIVGQVLIILTLILLTGSIIEIGSIGWNHPQAIAGLIFSLLTGLCFILCELRTKSPMLPLIFFRNATFSAAAATGFINNFVYYGIIFVMSIYFQKALFYTPLQAGLAFIPLTGAGVISNLVGSRIAANRGACLPMVFGFVLAAVGCALLMNINTTTRYIDMVWGLAIIPLGLGFAIPPMTHALLSTVPKERGGIASGVFNTVRQVGGAVGVAVFGSLVTGSVQNIVPGVQKILMTCSVLLIIGAVISFFGIQGHLFIKSIEKSLAD